MLTLAAVIAAVGIAIWKQKEAGKSESPVPQTTSSETKQSSDPAVAKPVRQASKEKLPELDPAKTPEAIQEEIGDLSSQYSPDAVKPLVAYLYHSDPAIREAARQGLMQLSEPSAVPYLRDAARAELNPEESKKLDEAADFLLIPEAKIEIKKKPK